MDVRQRYILDTEDRTTRVLRRVEREFRSLDRAASSALGGISRASSVANRALGGVVGGAITLAAGVREAGKAVNEFSRFETALTGVQKTTDLTGASLRKFVGDIEGLESRIPVTAQELSNLAAVAGQLGVRGSQNLSKFAETLARLDRSSDIQGEQAALTSVRILNLTDEDISQIDRYGAALVGLGNNAAATESEIVHMSTFVAQSVGRFDVATTEVLGLSTAMRELGLRAELSGGAVGRAFNVLETVPQLGGARGEALSGLLGRSLEDIQVDFREDSIGVFLEFLEALNAQGERASITLQDLGLSGAENLRVFPPLARNVDLVRERIALASDEWESNTALIKESDRAFDTHAGRVQQAANAWAQLRREIGGALAGLAAEPLQNFADGLSVALGTAQSTADGALNNLNADALIQEFDRAAERIVELNQEIETARAANEVTEFLDLSKTRKDIEKDIAEIIDALGDPGLERELVRLERRFDDLDQVIFSGNDDQRVIDRALEEQDRLTDRISDLRIELNIETDDQVELLEANQELDRLLAERRSLVAEFNTLADEAGGGIFGLAREAETIAAIESQIDEQNKLVTTLGGTARAYEEIEEAATDAAGAFSEGTQANTALLQEFKTAQQEVIEASRTTGEQIEAETTKLREKYSLLVEEEQITQQALDTFIDGQIRKLGLLEEEERQRQRLIDLQEREAEANRRTLEAFDDRFATPEERLLDDFAQAQEAAIALGVELDPETVARFRSKLGELREEAQETSRETEISLRDDNLSRAASLIDAVKTSYERLQEQIIEVRSLNELGIIPDDLEAEITTRLTERFDSAADGIEERWRGVIGVLRSGLSSFIRQGEVDFESLALSLVASFADRAFEDLLDSVFDEPERDALDLTGVTVQGAVKAPVQYEFPTAPPAGVSLDPVAIPVTYDFSQAQTRNVAAPDPIPVTVDTDPALAAIDDLLANQAATFDLEFRTVIDEKGRELIERRSETLTQDVALEVDRSQLDAIERAAITQGVVLEVNNDGRDVIENGLFPGGEFDQFVIAGDAGVDAANRVAAAWAESNSQTVTGFEDVSKNALSIFGDLGGKLSQTLGGAIGSSIGGSGGQLAGQVSGAIIEGILGNLFSFEGGGFTGDGSRSGGLDGRGGFLSVVHPNEQIIDLTTLGRHGTAGTSESINQVLHIQPGVSAEMIPQIQRAARDGAIAAIREQKRRGGKRGREL